MPATLLHVVGAVAQVAIGLLFLAGAIGKLRHRAMLPAIVANYRLLPRRLVAPVAATLPWAEIAIGGLLLIDGPGGRGAAVVAAGLLLLFAAAMAVNIRRGRTHIDCGCGFGPRQSLHRALVWRNLALAAALLPGMVAARPATPVEMLVALPAALALLALLFLLDAFLTLPRTRAIAA